METMNENIANEILEETVEAVEGINIDPKMIGAGVGAVAVASLIGVCIAKRKQIASKVKGVKNHMPHRSKKQKVEEGNEPELEAEVIEIRDVK